MQQRTCWIPRNFAARTARNSSRCSKLKRKIGLRRFSASRGHTFVASPTLSDGQPPMFLREDWALQAEPNTRESVLELLRELQHVDEDGKSLSDSFGDGEDLDSLLSRVTARAKRTESYDEFEAAKDFHLLLGAVSFLEKPGWRVGMTLLDDGRLTYAHRPMSPDEMLGQLVFAEGKDAVLRQVIDFVELHDCTDQFRQFFFGTDSY
jgi:hypothetical protein